MFNNSKEFESALLSVLEAIHSDSDNVGSWQNNLSDIAFHDVLEYALNSHLATGLKVKLGADDTLSISISSPRLTYEGLKFIEK